MVFTGWKKIGWLGRFVSHLDLRSQRICPRVGLMIDVPVHRISFEVKYVRAKGYWEFDVNILGRSVLSVEYKDRLELAKCRFHIKQQEPHIRLDIRSLVWNTGKHGITVERFFWVHVWLPKKSVGISKHRIGRLAWLPYSGTSNILIFLDFQWHPNIWIFPEIMPGRKSLRTISGLG